MCLRLPLSLLLLLPCMAMAQATRPATSPSDAAALLGQRLNWSNLKAWSESDAPPRLDPIPARATPATLSKVDLKQEARDMKRQALRQTQADSRRDRTALVRPLETDGPERVRLPEGRRHAAPPPGIGPFKLPIPPSRFRFLPGTPMPAISTPLVADEHGSAQFPLLQPYARPLGIEAMGLEDDEEADFSEEPPVLPDDDLPMHEDDLPPMPLLPMP